MNSQSVKPRHLKDLSNSERQQFLDSFDEVYCDCDGVVWYILRDFIPGSAEAISYLQKLGKRFTFVTNNSICSVAQHLEKFGKAQLTITEEQIVHPAQTVCDHLKSINFKGIVYCLAMAPFKQVLLNAGFQLADEGKEGTISSLGDLRAAIYDHPPVQAVVFDVDFNLTAAKLMRAHLHLKDANCLFIAGAADTTLPLGTGGIIGPGSFINMVAQSVGREPLVLGKPGAGLQSILRQRFTDSQQSGRVLFIGDSLSSDIEFAKQCGYQTLLVFTGTSTVEDLAVLPENHSQQPDYVADCLGDLEIK